MLKTLINAALLLASLAANAQTGLDCAAPKGRADALVCGTRELRDLDVRLAAMLQLELAQSNDPAILRSEQQEWATERQDCEDAICLTAVYERRIMEFENMQRLREDERAPRTRPGVPPARTPRESVPESEPERATAPVAPAIEPSLPEPTPQAIGLAEPSAIEAPQAAVVQPHQPAEPAWWVLAMLAAIGAGYALHLRRRARLARIYSRWRAPRGWMDIPMSWIEVARRFIDEGLLRERLARDASIDLYFVSLDEAVRLCSEWLLRDAEELDRGIRVFSPLDGFGRNNPRKLFASLAEFDYRWTNHAYAITLMTTRLAQLIERARQDPALGRELPAYERHAHRMQTEIVPIVRTYLATRALSNPVDPQLLDPTRYALAAGLLPIGPARQRDSARRSNGAVAAALQR